MEKVSEEQGVREAVAHYADGMHTGQVETLKHAFHEQAILCGYLDDHCGPEQRGDHSHRPIQTRAALRAPA